MDWYPDPADGTRERYWDGERWTHNTRPAQNLPPAPPAPVASPGPQQGTGGAGAVQQPGEPAAGGYGPYQGGQPTDGQVMGEQGQDPRAAAPLQQPGYGPYQGAAQPVGGAPSQPSPNGRQTHTADGVRLAGWWSRAFALLVDSLLTTLIASLLGWQWTRRIWQGYTAYFNDLMAQASAGTQTMPSPEEAADLLSKYGMTGAVTALSVIMWAVSLVYFLLLWRFRGASLGQMLAGIRVVPTEQGRAPRQLGWLPAAVRALVFSALANLPYISWINYLMPLFTKRRQTLHDLAARTQVVKSR